MGKIAAEGKEKLFFYYGGKKIFMILRYLERISQNLLIKFFPSHIVILIHALLMLLPFYVWVVRVNVSRHGSSHL
jgi:hypothetical protein